jgi:RNA polymerase sigma-70 factor (ECF subfamily)
MADPNRAALLNMLVVGYEGLKRRLTRRLGSAELAAEALQDTFVRLQCMGQVGTVRSPLAYLFRVAMSVAANRRIAEDRNLSSFETESLLNFIDDAPDPARVVEARSDFEALKRAMSELPVRRREILIAACMEDIPYGAIADRFGISMRTIQIEIKHALKHCALRLGRNPVGRNSFHPRRVSVSKDAEPGALLNPLDRISAAEHAAVMGKTGQKAAPRDRGKITADGAILSRVQVEPAPERAADNNSAYD